MAATDAKKEKHYCIRCKRTKAATAFYTYKNGEKVEICKECLCARVNTFEPDTFLWILEKMDVPYIPSEWNVLRDRAYAKDPSKQGGPAVVGTYLGKMKLKQWIDKETGKPYTWADSERLQAEYNKEHELTEEEIAENEAREKELKERYENGDISEAEYRTLASMESQKDDAPEMFPNAEPVNFNDFDSQFISEDELPDPSKDLTDEDKIYLALKWGRLYKPNEWIELEKKYDEMMGSFDIQDADTRNTLILMCKTDLKMNQAVDSGDIDSYQKLARVNDSLRKSGKFTAAQNKDKDNDQVDCVGVLVGLCEQLGGFIPNSLVDVKQDIIDICIKDSNKYITNLVTKDLGFGQQIENYLKKIQLEHETVSEEKDLDLNNEDIDEVEEITDVDIADYYSRIEEEKKVDNQINIQSNAYDKNKKGSENNESS